MNTHRFPQAWLVTIALLSSLALSYSAITSSLAEADSYIRYAKPNGMTTGNCLSWEAACTLKYAQGISVSGDEIWVTEGVYYPGSVVSDTFQLKDGIELYGGFPAAGGSWDQRDWTTHPTILSGDIDKNDLTEGGIVRDASNISGMNAIHVVTTEPHAIAFLDGFIITAGDASNRDLPKGGGGGIFNNSGNITLTRVTFSGNSAKFGGGMMNSYGTAMLNDVSFSGNTAANSGGGMTNYYDTATLTNVVFSGNTANSNGGGLYNESSNIMLTGVTFMGNTAETGGGMINYGTATLTRVLFSGNISRMHSGSGGGMLNGGVATLTDVTFSANTTHMFGYGGGLSNSDKSTAVLVNATFTNNIAGDGGGMYDYSHSTLTNVTFSSNRAYGGGGGFNNMSGSSTTMTGVTFSNNIASGGGGIVISYSTNITFTNVTLSDNQATTTGGGMYISMEDPALYNVTFSGNSAAFGGAIYCYSCSPALTNITLYGNSATLYGGGIYNKGDETYGVSHPTLTNTILWQNSPDQIFNDSFSSTTATYSDIQGGWSGEGNISADPLLGPLMDTGGFMLTHALMPGSPAIDTGSPTICPTTDQRGFPRPMDGNGDGTPRCDMGSYELRVFKIFARQFLPMIGK